MLEKVSRSWGHYRVLFRSKRLCIKILTAEKHSHLSFQRHFHRSEIWLILHGSLGVDTDRYWVLSWRGRGKRVRRAIHIPTQMWHKFFAHQKSRILEIQYGDDVKENDIERKSHD